MKILIVGAGPIGCYIARLFQAGDSGFNLEIIEEHNEIGRPIHCAGLISADAISEIKVPLVNNFTVNKIDGAELFLDGDSFSVRRKDVAVVIDREKFDRALGEGLTINFNTRFVGIEKEGPGYLVETDKGEYYADIVIGADGANSALRKAAGFKEDVKYLRGVQFRMRYDKIKKDFVQLHFKNPFFAWVVPESEGIVRVGILSNNPYHDLLEFLKERSIETEILEKFAGVVPFGRCSTRRDNLVLVGDAACQVKPLTQGGIYYGMRCAEILVDCVINKRLCDYEKIWHDKFGREIEIGLQVRQIYQQLSHDTLAKLYAVLKKNADLFERFGDFENHSKFISAIFRTPGLQGILGKILLNVLKNIEI